MPAKKDEPAIEAAADAPGEEEEQGPVTIELGGATRTLLVDLNTMCRVEEALGTNLFLEPPLRTVSPTEVRLLLWACLAHDEDEDLTPHQVAAWVKPKDIERVSTALMTVLEPFKPVRAPEEPAADPDETAAADQPAAEPTD